MIVPKQIRLWDRRDTPAKIGTVYRIDTYRLSDRPRVILVECAFSTVAVQLPAHGEVMLRRLGIGVDTVGEGVPPSLDLDLLVARGIEVGGVPIARRIGEDPMSESGGDVDTSSRYGSLLRRHPGYRRAWEPPSGTYSADVDVDVESHVRAKVELRRPGPSP